ncbi:MAG: hypothetical protein M0010_03500 [Actinomycetota bacterium]|nr:hypothetical protein [Actinomycetota bacterium]
MTTYFTADQHFGHHNIIEYCDRPFHSVGEMNTVLVANWNAVVGPHDTVHVLGDVAMGRREESMPLIGRLAGHKILYPGNHDRCWYGHGERALRLEQEYLDAGFDEIRQGPLAVTVGNREVLVCHLPYQGDSGETERYAKFRPVDEGMWLLHGHVHEKWRQQGRMRLAGRQEHPSASVRPDHLDIRIHRISSLNVRRDEVGLGGRPSPVGGVGGGIRTRRPRSWSGRSWRWRGQWVHSERFRPGAPPSRQK